MEYSFSKKLCCMLFLIGMLYPTAQAMEISKTDIPSAHTISAKKAELLALFFMRENQGLSYLQLDKQNKALLAILGVIGDNMTLPEIAYLLFPAILAEELEYLEEWLKVSSKTLLSGNDIIFCVDIAKDGTKIATGSAKNEVKLLTVDGTCLKTFTIGGYSSPHGKISARALTLGVSDSGARLVVGGDEHTTKARICDQEMEGMAVALSPHEGVVTKADINSQGTRSITYDDSRNLRIWDAQTGKMLHQIMSKDFYVSFSFSQDGDHVYLISKNRITTLTLETASFDLVIDFSIAPNLINTYSKSTAFSSDKTKVGFILQNGKVTVLERSTGKELYSPSIPCVGFIYRAIALSPCGTQALLFHPIRDCSQSIVSTTTAKDSIADLWDLKKGTKICSLEHKQYISSAVFSSDGEKIITASYDGTVKMWDVTIYSKLKNGVPLSLCFLVKPAYKAKKEGKECNIHAGLLNEKELTARESFLIDSLAPTKLEYNVDTDYTIVQSLLSSIKI